MTSDSEQTSPSSGSPEAVDRRYVGICGAVWLLTLAVGAVATVAMVNLGRGHDAGAAGSNRALYIVIGLSALTIVVAIPLLLKARRAALDAQAAGERAAESPPRPIPARGENRIEKMRVFGSDVDPAARRGPEVVASDGVVDRVVLRGSAALLTIMGASLTCVGAASYLLARNWTTAAWVALGLGAVVVAAAPVAVVAYQRLLPSRD